MRNRPRLLVTGFGPFPGMAHNPSEAIARRVAASPRWRLLDAEVGALVLPTTYAAIEGALKPALRQPVAAILLIGVAGRARAVRIEARALNRASILSPDAAGFRPRRLGLAAWPAFRRSPLPPAAVAPILKRHGVPCRASQDAGRYLCNAAFFEALAQTRPVLFLHIPKPPRRKPLTQPALRCRSTWEERLAGAFTAIAADLVRRGRAAGFRASAPRL